jgi:hypothetical protein
MSNHDKKIITGICPFQTQLGQIPRPDSHAQLLLGPKQVPLLKMSCDQENCLLWHADYHMCAVSAVPFLLVKQIEETQKLNLLLSDIRTNTEHKPTPSGCGNEN